MRKECIGYVLIAISRCCFWTDSRGNLCRSLHSLKLTANAPENRPSQKEISSSNYPFSGAKICENVSFKEGSSFCVMFSVPSCNQIPSNRLETRAFSAMGAVPTSRCTTPQPKKTQPFPLGLGFLFKPETMWTWKTHTQKKTTCFEKKKWHTHTQKERFDFFVQKNSLKKPWCFGWWWWNSLQFE